LRGINGTRMVVLMNKADIEENGLRDGDEIDLLGAAADAVPRVVRGLRVVAYLCRRAAKSIPVRVHKRS